MGLLDQLLAGTRFDNKSRLQGDMQNSGMQQPVPGLPQQAAPVVMPNRGNSPDDMIRQMRAQRQAQRDMEAAQYMQQMNRQVLPQR